MSEIAEQTLDEIAKLPDVFAEGVDGVVETLEVIRTNPTLVVVAGLVGLAAGGVGGYFFAKKKLEAFYVEQSSYEIAQAKEFYASLNKVDVESGDILSPMEVLERTHPEAAASLREYRGEAEAPAATEEDLIEATKREQGEPYDDEMDEKQLAKMEAKLLADRPDAVVESKKQKVETVTTEVRNVFSDPHFDLDEEKKHRSSSRPYVISHDEYFNTEREYDNISLTYFEQDDTLVDEKDDPVTEVDKTIGDEALVRFGHGSKDKNVVYVRNEKMESDFEITRSSGSYLVEVLGLDPEPEPNSLKHSSQARRDFRRGMG